MNKKQLLMLIVAGAVICAAGYLVNQKKQSSWGDNSRRMGQKLFADFDVNKVESLAIRSGTNTLVVAKKGDVWGVPDRGNYPANFSTIHDLLLKVSELKVVQPIRAGTSQIPRLQLDSPEKGETGGTLVEFRDASGKALSSLLLGKEHTRESGSASPMGGGAFPNGRYVMVGNDPKTICVVSETFSSIKPQASDWLDKDFVKVEKLKSAEVTLAQPTNSWKVFRETEGPEWKLADAKPEEKLDTGKTSFLSYLFSNPTFQDVAPGKKPEETGLDKPTVARLETFENLVYTVKIGKPTDGDAHHYVQVDVAGQFPKERAPGKDEKPEDKEKLDKEFKANLTKLEEKLKREQVYAQWTYVVEKWVIESLLKERHTLLVEKKDETKPEGGAGAPGGVPGGLDALKGALPQLNLPK